MQIVPAPLVPATASSNTRHTGAESNHPESFDFEAVATRLERDFAATRNEFMLKVVLPENDGGFNLTIFPNGRAVITGTDDPAIARSIYARYVGT